MLQLAVRGSEGDNNEVYINPPTTICTPNSADANQAASIFTLFEHDDDNMRNEYATNQNALSSTKLQPGPNTLLICVRDSNGDLDGNLDDIFVNSIALHYHTTASGFIP